MTTQQNSLFEKLSTDIGKLLRSIWLPISSLISVVGAIYQFYQLWLGDSATITWIIGIIFYLILLILLLFIGYATEIYETKIQPTQVKTRLRYETWSKLARLFLVVILLVTLFGGIVLYQRIQELENKFVVVIANFESDRVEYYGITDLIIGEVTSSFENEQNVIVITPNVTISEQNRDEANKLGERYRADLVIWGWYVPTATEGMVVVHFENHTGLANEFRFEQSEKQSYEAAISEFDRFAIHASLKRDITEIIQFVRAIEGISRQDYVAAIKNLTQALNASDEQNTTPIQTEDILTREEILNLRGLLYLFTGNVDSAKSDFDNAIMIDIELPSSYENLGILFLKEHDYTSAVESFSKAITLGSQSPTTYFNRGVAYYLQGELDLALKDFDQSIKLDPARSAYYAQRAAVYADLNQVNDALSDIEISLNIDRLNSSAYNIKGVILFENKDFQGAITAFTKVTEISPDSFQGYLNRGNAYVEVKEFEKAVDDYTRADELDTPTSIQALIFQRRGISYSLLGEENKKNKDWNGYCSTTFSAVEDFTEALTADSKSQYYFSRAMIYKKMGDEKFPASVEHCYSYIVTPTPKGFWSFLSPSPSVVDIAGNPFYDLQFYDKEFGDLNTILEKKDDPSLVINANNELSILASAYYQSAIEYETSIGSANPTDECYYHFAALNSYSQAIKISGDPEFYYSRALVHLKLGVNQMPLSVDECRYKGNVWFLPQGTAVPTGTPTNSYATDFDIDEVDGAHFFDANEDLAYAEKSQVAELVDKATKLRIDTEKILEFSRVVKEIKGILNGVSQTNSGEVQLSSWEIEELSSLAGRSRELASEIKQNDRLREIFDVIDVILGQINDVETRFKYLIPDSVEGIDIEEYIESMSSNCATLINLIRVYSNGISPGNEYLGRDLRALYIRAVAYRFLWRERCPSINGSSNSQYDELALEDFDRLLQRQYEYRDNYYFEALYSRAMLYVDLNERQLAIRDLQEVISRSYNSELVFSARNQLDQIAP